MKARRPRVESLWQRACGTAQAPSGALLAPDLSVALHSLVDRSVFGDALASLADRSVLLATRDQLPSALALLELDGWARRVVLATPDVPDEPLAALARQAQADVVVTDAPRAAAATLVVGGPLTVDHAPDRRARVSTEWLLLTSGTSGAPKLVRHSLDSLAGGLAATPGAASSTVWSTFYDIRRYGGLQIFLRAVIGGAPLVLSSAGETPRAFLKRAGQAGVTHVSGTPSHWRGALMSGAAQAIQPRYVRLSGEIADQPILDALKAAYPAAAVIHAFASTEAGVAFEVRDGLAGFPAEFVDVGVPDAELKVVDGTLRIRSRRNAQRYVGASDALADPDGYVDTGDLVVQEQGRYQFRGRRSGVINVGGLKVHPEEVEAVLNADPRVRLSRVCARRNPITGAVIVADVVVESAAQPGGGSAGTLEQQLLSMCRRVLPPHKVPALVRVVSSLEVNAAGKLVRPRA